MSRTEINPRPSFGGLICCPSGLLQTRHTRPASATQRRLIRVPPPRVAKGTDGDRSLIALHKEILAGHTEVIDEVVERLLRIAHQRLRRSLRRIPDDCLVDAVEDAILDYVRDPRRFCADRGVPLEGFVSMAARRNALNYQRAESARKAREGRFAVNSECTRTELEGTRDDNKARLWIAVLEDSSGPAERRAIRLWLKGERRTDTLASVLGWSGLPAGDQRREVKRFKDRLLKRVDRAAKRTKAQL